MTTINCSVSPCTVVLEVPLLSLSLDDAGLISGAILMVWAVAFGFRMLIRTLKTDEVGPDESQG